MEKSILEQIQNPRNFSAFINENMKTSTFQVAWNTEMNVEYEPSESWSAATADYAAAMLGTVIDSNSDRVKHDMPSIGEISGTLARMGDEWQISNNRLKRFYYMENRFREKRPDLTDTQRKEQYKNVVKYLFNPYELAAIAPHRRIWAQYLEGLSDGQVTLTKKNNAGGVVWEAPIPVGIKKYCLPAKSVVWDVSTLKDIDVLGTLTYIEELAGKTGRKVLKHRISKSTAALICQCEQFQRLIGTKRDNWETSWTPGIGLNTINEYLATINGTGFAPFEVVDELGNRPESGAFGLFKTGRITAMCADRVAVLKVSDPLESVDPVPNKVYSSYYDNLISQWRDTSGRYVAYEMFAFPAFTGKDNALILDVTKKEA